ncbi:diphosphomevalonate decarboxylase [Paramicrobacterium agarici]|uniref:diphosphomevalonate decarboxylase n=1 Tax=Paramicrobacterium agarici TaxID=630514 RepID=A0A2A9E065_9MICO|nr:diphosphomevalonate decarboxylase [Microbacterium agarici]PFG31570.1 diphosphomevalonate decarboxylase [Microbacterium agarici]
MSTAIAHPNIALAKYWGKRDATLILPAAGSLSLTLDVFPTTTTVTVGEDDGDVVSLDGVQLSGDESGRVRTVLDRVRELSGRREHAHVTSVNTVPTAAGLASSAAAFAALATAAADAYGLEADDRMLSRIARRGSGSACRSIFAGLARWNAGDDDESSYAEPLRWSGAPLAMIVAVVSSGRKSVSSRDAMRRTAESSPYFPAWVESSSALLEQMSAAVAEADFTRIGQLTEQSALRMHASMFGAVPPVRYLTAASIALFDAVVTLRASGVEAYATADAGPNVKVLCRADDARNVVDGLTALMPNADYVVAHAGSGSRIVDGEAA